MNKILEWNLDTMTVVIEPGVLVMELANAAQEKGGVLSAGAGGKDSFRWWNVMTMPVYESRRLWRYEKLCGFHGMCDAKR